MEFESILKVIVMAVAAVGIPVGAYAAVAATRAIWSRPAALPDPGLADEVESLRARVRDLEGLEARMAELEERVDFSERLLARGRDADAQRIGQGGGA